MIPTIRTGAPFPRVTVRYALVALCYRPGFWHVAVSSGDPLSILSGSSVSGHRRHGVLRQGVHPPRARLARRAQAGGVLPRRAQAVRAPSAPRPGRAAALLHRRRPRQGAADPGHARRRLRRARRRAQAGRHGRVQPVRVRQDQRRRLAERGRGRHRLRRAQGRRALHRQGLQPDQPLRRDEAGRRQAVRGGQPLRRQPRDPLLRGALRQRGGQPRLGGAVLPAPGRAGRQSCRSPTSG